MSQSNIPSADQAERVSPDPAAMLRADVSAVEIDVRCALVMARIALQTLAHTTPQNHARILSALDDAMDSTRLEQGECSDAVIGLLNDFKHRLVETAGESKVWYLEE